MADSTEIDATADDVVEISSDEMLNRGNELYANGLKHLYTKEYQLAADEFSEACSALVSVYGDKAPELGMPYLKYAKALIALAQEEQCLMDVPQETNDDDDDDSEDEIEDNTSDKTSGTRNEESEAKVKSSLKEEISGKKLEDKPGQTSEEKPVEKAAADSSDSKAETDVKEDKSTTAEVEVKVIAGPSTSKGDSGDDVDSEDTPEDELAANLQVAWEVLEVAVSIFSAQGEEGKVNLAEAYSELAQISMENNHPEAAVDDLRRALDIQMKLNIDNRRIIAEIHYKIGMCMLMDNDYDESMLAYQKSIELLKQEIEAEEEKPDESRSQKMIDDLKDMCEDLQAKITEVEQTKRGEADKIREALAMLSSSIQRKESTPSNAAGPSSSSSGTETKPVSDISHLIKRKKPESTPDADEPVAKRASTE